MHVVMDGDARDRRGCEDTSPPVNLQTARPQVCGRQQSGFSGVCGSTFSLDAFSRGSRQCHTSFLPKNVSAAARILSDVARLRRVCARHAMLLGAMVWPTCILVILVLLWGPEALHGCTTNHWQLINFYMSLVLSAIVGGGICLIIVTGVTSAYLHWIFLHTWAMQAFAIFRIVRIAWHACGGFEVKDNGLDSVIWLLQRVMFLSVVLASVYSMEASLGQDLRSRNIEWARAGEAVLTVLMGILYLLAFIKLNLFTSTIQEVIRFCVVISFAACDLAGSGHFMYTFHMLANLARAAEAEIKSAGLLSEVPIAGQASRLTQSYVWIMMWTTSIMFLMVCSRLAIPILHGSRADETLMGLTLIDAIVDSLAALCVSGVLTRGKLMSEASVVSELRRLEKRAETQKGLASLDPIEGDGWWSKVSELSQRGFTLEALMRFYRGLGKEYMSHFSPNKHTTKDVVRAAIIPESKAGRCSLARVMMNGKPVQPKNMVTHNWGNLFRDLVAAIVADAFGHREFGVIADLLTWKIDELESMLSDAGLLQNTYWVCAFSVSQHDSICGSNPYHDIDPVLHREHPVCTCNKTKYFNTDGHLNSNGQSVECELNKFDDVMALLAAKDPGFSQIICVDVGFDLFSRAWCIAEIAQAFGMGLEQRLQVVAGRHLHKHEDRLRALKVEKMEATRQEDKDEILAKISDKVAFDAEVQNMIFGRCGLLAGWASLDGGQKLDYIGWWLRWARMRGNQKSCWLDA